MLLIERIVDPTILMYKIQFISSLKTAGSLLAVTQNRACVGQYSFINFTASAVCFNNPLRTGRYVGIMTTKKQILTLCEVQIYSRGNYTVDRRYFELG